jgi:hypothetical protein
MPCAASRLTIEIAVSADQHVFELRGEERRSRGRAGRPELVSTRADATSRHAGAAQSSAGGWSPRSDGPGRNKEEEPST